MAFYQAPLKQGQRVDLYEGNCYHITISSGTITPRGSPVHNVALYQTNPLKNQRMFHLFVFVESLVIA